MSNTTNPAATFSFLKTPYIPNASKQDYSLLTFTQAEAEEQLQNPDLRTRTRRELLKGIFTLHNPEPKTTGLATGESYHAEYVSMNGEASKWQWVKHFSC